MPTSQHDRFENVFKTLGESRRGSFVRAFPLQYQATPLDSSGSLRGGRYNAAGTFEMLYLGENADTVTRETRLIVKNAIGVDTATPQPPKIIITINFNLQRLGNLTDPAILKRLRVNASSLVTEWTQTVRAGRDPITQQLGEAARTAGLEGLIVPSKRHPGRSNIVVIPANMLIGSYIEVHEPIGFAPGVVVRIEGTC